MYEMESKKRKYLDYNIKNIKNKKIKGSTEETDEEIDVSNLLETFGASAASSGVKEKNKKIEREANHIYFYSEVNRDTIYELISLIMKLKKKILLYHLK